RLALCLRLAHAFQLLQEALLGVHGDERDLEGVAKGGDHLLALLLAHQSVIDEHARELIAHRAMDKQGGNRGVDTARETADDASLPNLSPNPRDLLLGARRRRPGALTATDLTEEAGEDLLAVRG